MKYLFFLTLCVLALPLNCHSLEPNDNKPVILVTVPPFEFFVKKIGQGLITTSSIIPSNANAHTYDPNPKEITKMSSALIWFRYGEPIERKVTKVLELNNPDLKVVDLSNDLDLLLTPCQGGKDHCHAVFDLHFWLSLPLARHFSTTIALELIELLPEAKKEITQNLDTLLGELFALEKLFKERLAPCKGQTILVAHPAFNYFFKPYGIQQLPIEFAGKEPTLAQLDTLVKKAIQQEAQVVILEQGHSTKLGLLIADRLDLPTCLVNPLQEDVFETMQKLSLCVCP